MKSFKKIAFRIFSSQASYLVELLPEIRENLKRGKFKYSAKEYLSLSLFSSFLCFIISLPIFSFILSFSFPIFSFSFFFSITLSLLASAIVFIIFLHYPKFVANSIAKKIDAELPFATLYLKTLSSSKLPLHQVFELFGKFGEFPAIRNEIKGITTDIKYFGLDVITAIERAIDRTPSKEFRELLWGILSTTEAGGDINNYLKEKADSLFQEYRRKLHQFSQSLTIYIEIYLTSVVLGTIFFSVLTSIISAISKVTGNIVFIQFLLVFIFLPLVSIIFAFIIKSAAPGEEK